VLAPLAPDVPLPESNQSVDSYFGSHVFDRRTMKRYLSNVENERFHAALAAHRPIDFATADAIANALLRWATERGATHYTHWFQVRFCMLAAPHPVDASDGWLCGAHAHSHFLFLSFSPRVHSSVVVLLCRIPAHHGHVRREARHVP
jgi:hypothetical protein